MLRRLLRRLRGGSSPVEELGREPLPRRWNRFTLLKYLGTTRLGETFVAKLAEEAARSTNGESTDLSARELLIVRRGLTSPSDRAFLAHALDEVRILCQLDHPSICQLVSVESVEGAPLLVSEYAPGKSLLRVLGHARAQGEPLSWPIAVFIAHEAAAILEHLHQQTDNQGTPWSFVLCRGSGFAPEDFFLDFSGDVRLANAGIAFLLRSVSVGPEERLFHDHAPFYISPEGLKGEVLQQSADTFCLGWMLYELLTGKRLFAGHGDLETIEMIMDAAVPPPSKERPGIPPELDAIVLECLSRSPSDRRPAGEVKPALARLTDMSDAKAQLEKMMRATFKREMDQLRDDLIAWSQC